MTVLPHNLDAEASVLGGIMLRNEILKLLDLGADEFYDPRHQEIYRAMNGLAAESRPIDEVTVEAELDQMGKLATVGGLAYVAALALRVPTTDNVIAYAEIVADLALKRRCLLTLSGLTSADHGEYAPGLNGSELLAEAQRALARITPTRKSGGGRIGDYVVDHVLDIRQKLNDRRAGKTVHAGIPTGIYKLDTLTGGLPTGILTIVGARPGHGKTTIGIAFADRCDRDGHGGAQYFTFEDQASSFAQRMLGRETASVDIERIRSLDLSEDDFVRLSVAADHLRPSRTWRLELSHGQGVDFIVREYRRRKEELKTRLLLVDYIQLVAGPRGMMQKNAIVDYNLEKLNNLAGEENLAVVVFSQLNREVERRDNKRPQLSDFRDSGVIEQVGKFILGLYHAHAYDDSESANLLEAIILKNHNGRSNVSCDMHWDKPFGIVSNLSERP